MAVDRIHLGVVGRVDHENFASSENPSGSVGVSEVEEMLDTVYGADAPYDRRITFTTKRALEAGTAISTDEFLLYPELKNISRLAPHFLKLAVPLIDATDRLGRVMDAHMSAIENEDIVITHEAGTDAMYGGTAFDLMSIVIATEMDVPHPQPRFLVCLKHMNA